MPEIAFFVPGDPAPQGSKSRTAQGVMYESSRRLKPWREAVAYSAMAARHRVKFRTPVCVALGFRLRIDADVDKLARGALDGLTMGGVFDDDKLVVRLEAEKLVVHAPQIATLGERGCSIVVKSWDV